jgi:hypothetical protein
MPEGIFNQNYPKFIFEPARSAVDYFLSPAKALPVGVGG